MQELLRPVCDAAYATKPVEKLTILQIAHDTNQALGYDLFDELYYPSLVRDFATVARAVAYNAVHPNDA